MVNTNERPFDVIITGVTGFSGRLLVQYFARRIDHDLKWAIAGRDEGRLRKLREWLGAEHRDVKIQVVEVCDDENAATLAGMARVILTAVGPYDELGEPLVRACAQLGTDYVDITGEPNFVTRMHQKYHEVALKSGALIVHCCGFDSIPADIGAYLTAVNLPSGGAKTVSCQVQTRGGLSGGTWASLLKVMRETPQQTSDAPFMGTDSKTPWVQTAPYSRHSLLKLPTIDPLIVRRSSRIHPQVYGEAFEYKHFLKLQNRGQAYMIIAGVIALRIMTRIPQVFELLRRLHPAGAGPSIDQRKAGGYQLRFFGHTPGKRVILEVQGSNDAYTDTGRMASECAILLVTRRKDLPTQAGITTPVGAFGRLLSTPLIAAGIRLVLLEASGRFRVNTATTKSET